MKHVAVISYFPTGLEAYQEIIVQSDFIVAVDSGADALMQLGIIPDICIGDFDSVNAEILAKMPKKITLPKQKDETDTHAALLYVYDLEPDASVTLFASMTGRVDHQFGLLALYYRFMKQNRKLQLMMESGEIRMLKPGVHQFPNQGETYVSLFAYHTDVKGLNLSGMLYPLTDATLPIGSDLGCSNAFVSSHMEISFTSGTLLIYFIERR